MQFRDLAQPLDRLRRPQRGVTPNRLRRPQRGITPNRLRRHQRDITPDRFHLRPQLRITPDRFPPRNLPRDLLLTIDQELDFTSAANISDLPFPCKMNC